MFDRSVLQQLSCLLAGSLICASGALAQTSSPQRPQPIVAWSAKPVQATPWTAPNKPHWKLSEVLAKHSGQRSWQEDIVSDRDFTARYISMAPGEKTKRQFFADDRVFWIVQSGRMRVSIDGQEPFVAAQGSMVQVPYRVPYSIETEGSEPSLRFEVRGAQAVPLYPIDETPAPLDGKKYMKVTYTGRGTYDEINKPHLDFTKDVVHANGRGGPFVKDDKTFANMIRGPGQAAPHWLLRVLADSGRQDRLPDRRGSFLHRRARRRRVRAPGPLASRQLRRQWHGYAPRHQSTPGWNA
jgi:mannose-6-phosphate isomerase-like protein (cupin superfamily)